MNLPDQQLEIERCVDVQNPPGAWAADGGGPRESGGRPADATDGKGALYVTRPNEISVVGEGPQVEGCRVLLTGTDTLDVGLYVEFGTSWSRIVTKLAQLKAKARGTTGYVVGGRCLVLPGGKPNYQFHIQYPGFHLYLSRKARPDGDTPNAFVSLNSGLLWHQGERGAIALVEKELAELADGTVQQCRMNRCDLAADLLLPGGVTDGFVRHLAVSHVKKQRIYIESNQVETLYVGAAKSDISLRIYNKSTELEYSEKSWFLPLWGLTENADVWRFEFQLRRPILRAWQVNSVDDLLTKRGDVWRYLTDEWFSLRLHDNENVSRRTVHPLWQVVQDCSDRFGPAGEGIQRTRPVPSVDPSRVLKQSAASLVGFAARKCETDFEMALQSLTQELRAEFEARNFTDECQRKAIQLGIKHTEEHS